MNCSFYLDNSPCGEFGNDSSFLPVQACTFDVSDHLLSLGISLKRGFRSSGVVLEKDLILNRAGCMNVAPETLREMTVCPKHRRELTVDWPGRKRRVCGYPSHVGKRTQMRNPRRVNMAMSQEIFRNDGIAIPAGTAICENCRKKHKTHASVHLSGDQEILHKETTDDIPPETEVLTTVEQAECSSTLKETNTEQEISLISHTTDVSITHQEIHIPSLDATEQPTSSQEFEYETFSSSSQDSVKSQDMSLWSDEVEEQKGKREALNTAITTLTNGRTSPILSTLNTTWDDISSTQQKYYQRKAKETIFAALTVISPGQEQQLWDAVRKVSDVKASVTKHKSFSLSSPIIDSLVIAYHHADSWRTKRQILSIFANDFSRSELMTLIPSLTKWTIDQARKHATEAGKGQSIPEEPIHRARISYTQIHHFIDYISGPDMVQDVAFGTKTLELDCGESIVIPAVVRTMIPSRIIDQYLIYCDQQRFEPAGKRSLYRMIEVCGASLQKSLAGLDNTTAEGNDAIDHMIEIISTLGIHGAERDWVKATQKKIRAAKRYLKTEFKGHVGRENSCADHCTTHALSDATTKEFQRKCALDHDVQCSNCLSLKKVLEEIEAKMDHVSMSADERARIKHEYKQDVDSINAWKGHLLRTINQEEAKQDALTALDKETCLIVMDWAMKFLPHRYRERMSEFFGKRGRSWHVSAVITKKEDKYEVECFVHIFDACTQDSFAVASVTEHLLKTIKKEIPEIKSAFLRSDNAGCYHSGQLLLSLQEIGKRSGITPIRYDFSDPQSGKDICDRKTAPMKAHIKRWVNEKHDVLTALDMKNALESHNGVKGCRVAVVKVDLSAENTAGVNKIPGISLLNNFAFTKGGIRVWRAYNTGLGKLYNYDDLEYTYQKDTNLLELHGFGPRLREVGTVSTDQRPKTEIFSCCESSCVLTFKSMADADAHMDTGKHVKVSERDSVYDTVKKRWAERVTEMNVDVGIESRYIPVVQASSTSQDQEKLSPEGWALKSKKKSKRMVQKAKMFLLDKFHSGITGNKADPIQVAKEMKIMRNKDGNLLFTPDEWRTPKQITSFFSRMSVLTKRQQPENVIDELEEDDLIALEEENNLEELYAAVLDDLEAVLHPITASDVDICQLKRDGTLKTLKLTKLRDICTDLKLELKGRQNRKDTFIIAIENYANKCSCCT